jgi:hypothetical protein
MISFWPADPIEQTTPRAGPNGQLLEHPNPFELPGNVSPRPLTPSYHHHLLNTHSPSPALSPLGPLTPVPALPTTHLTLHAPEFNMQQPPVPPKLSAPAQNPPLAPSSSKGQIHVKLIQARSLCVASIYARPYVVVQFEQNEFVGRDPINESDKEVKGTATTLSRNSSSSALSALGAIGTKVILDTAKRIKISGISTPSSRVPSPKPSPSSLAPPAAPPSTTTLFGRPSAHNPVWKHQVSLCVSVGYSVFPCFLMPRLVMLHRENPSSYSTFTTVQCTNMAFLARFK